MTVGGVEFVVLGAKSLGSECLESIAETNENGLTEHIGGSDGEAHSCEVLVISEMSCVVEVDELEPYFHSLGDGDRKEEKRERFNPANDGVFGENEAEIFVAHILRGPSGGNVVSGEELFVSGGARSPLGIEGRVIFHLSDIL